MNITMSQFVWFLLLWAALAGFGIVVQGPEPVL